MEEERTKLKNNFTTDRLLHVFDMYRLISFY